MDGIILKKIHGVDNMMHWTTNNGQYGRNAIWISFDQGSGI